MSRKPGHATLLMFCVLGLSMVRPVPIGAAPAKPDKSVDRKKTAESDWTRIGPLGPTPRRTTEDYPLSDQENKGKWRKHEPLCDEFEGAKLDPAKWWPNNPTWKGRSPAPFLPSNVRVQGGKLNLTMRKEEPPEEFARLKDKEGRRLFHTYTAASVKSKTTVCFGYFEVKAKPMNSAGSSSFWFTGRYEDEKGRYRNEIDVFEIGGNAPGFERRYNMNLHVFETPEEKRHWSRGGRWLAPWRLADDYHVYGLEWNKTQIKYYVDGVVVRTVENTHWHQPLHMLFDSETMPDWFGLPNDEDLPSTYSIEYVRAWKQGD